MLPFGPNWYPIAVDAFSRVKGNGIIMVMETLTIEIPREIAQTLRLPPQDQENRLRLELAVALYSQSILGLGKAAELAQLTPLRFDEELGRRRIPLHYGDSELAQDVAYGYGRQ
jgi:predicted HTH domain antitoxin